MKDGRIITKDNEYLTCKLRFDIYVNQMEVSVEEKSYLITKPEGFKEFIIDSTRIQYISYIDGNITKKAFMLVESDSGAYRLFTRKKVIYHKADEAKPYTDPKPERFEQKEDEYYLAFQNNPALQISSLKKLVKALPDLKPIIDVYPEKKVDFDKPDELLKLVEFINQKVKI
jgi:hypothetical protein